MAQACKKWLQRQLVVIQDELNLLRTGEGSRCRDYQEDGFDHARRGLAHLKEGLVREAAGNLRFAAKSYGRAQECVKTQGEGFNPVFMAGVRGLGRRRRRK